ncbi:MAG: helix-turn-helix transcriptional regulator [Clostridia bacterium]|nr:helix-turn-helix transcriptional regulator [Clostridia bacterium]
MKSKVERYVGTGLYDLRHYTASVVADFNLKKLHYDDSPCLVYFKHGSGEAKLEGRHYEITEGTVFLVSPYELHRFFIKEEEKHERFALYIREGLLSRFPEADALLAPILGRKKGYGNLIFAHTVKEYGIDQLFDEILQKAKCGTPKDDVLAACKIIELLDVLLEATKNGGQSAPVPHSGKMNEVLKYLDGAFLEEITVDTVAARFFISKYHLCRAFKESTGVSLWEYVIWRRLLHFNECVRCGMTIEDACRASAFHNYSNFYRLYVKHFGMSPKEFATKTEHP